ncbi:MAG: glutamate 5-kinase [Planctomycetaceae bacterium]
MVNLIRRELIETARTVVVKVGTGVLSNDDDSLNIARIALLVEQVDRIRRSGRRVVLVSSGAVGAGMGLLGLKERPRDLPHLQAAAASGQAHLIRLYDDCLQTHGCRAAQLLLTANDFRTRERYLNVRNTVNSLFDYPIVPVINENDSVSISEIQFGDNDQLAGMVSNLLDDSILVILSVVDGLFDGDPDSQDSRVIPLVKDWDQDLLALAADTKSRRGTGGMASKLDAIRRVVAVGENAILANGRHDDVLDRILAGEEVGTLFLAQGQNVPAWKRWIGYTIEPAGRLFVDDGARQALCRDGRSLLPIGIARVEGDFGKGAVVAVVDSSGYEFARGLTNYDSRSATSLCGRRTSEIGDILGEMPYEEIIHRDNLAILG